MTNRTLLFKGFTIIELVVVAALSVIISFLSISALQLFQNQFSDYSIIQNKSIDTNNFKTIFSTDILKANLVLREKETILMKFEDYDITYSFSSNQIVRQPLLSEVNPQFFSLKSSNLNTQLINVPIEIGLVDRIEFSHLSDSDSLKFSFSKEYSLQNLLDYAR